MRVAILDDESAELDRVEQTLQQIPAQGEQAWTVHRFARGEDLLKQLKRETFDLLILDWQLPDLSGLQLLRWSREHLDAPPPAIMLTSRDAEQDIVQALNSGADDYVSKPFRPNELKARVAAVLRRHGGTRPAQHEVQTFNDLSFDDAELTVTRAGAPISLTEREYRLARCLFANLGTAVVAGISLRALLAPRGSVVLAAAGYPHLSLAQQAWPDRRARLAVADHLRLRISVGERGDGRLSGAGWRDRPWRSARENEKAPRLRGFFSARRAYFWNAATALVISARAASALPQPSTLTHLPFSRSL
ncbi:two-component response regulator [Pseudomonas aeruginosa]|nr:two-component response regulator [Pseudomonas aeruginosa]